MVINYRFLGGPIALHGLVHFLNTIRPFLTKVIYIYFDRISFNVASASSAAFFSFSFISPSFPPSRSIPHSLMHSLHNSMTHSLTHSFFTTPLITSHSSFTTVHYTTYHLSLIIHHSSLDYITYRVAGRRSTQLPGCLLRGRRSTQSLLEELRPLLTGPLLITVPLLTPHFSQLPYHITTSHYNLSQLIPSQLHISHPFSHLTYHIRTHHSSTSHTWHHKSTSHTSLLTPPRSSH